MDFRCYCRTAAGLHKKCHSSQATAQARADEMAATYGEPYDAYRCPRGGAWWHVGRPKPPKPILTPEEWLDHPWTLRRLDAKDRRREAVARAAMQPRRLP